MALNFVIDTDYFETNTVIDTDFDIKKAYNHLIDAHEVQLYELLGKDLYDRLQTILDDIANASAIELELIEFLKPFMVKATELNLTPFLNTPITAKGSMERSGDYTKRSADETTARILDNIRAKEEFYAEKCREFLKCNSKYFPEYQCNGSGNDFFSPIHFF